MNDKLLSNLLVHLRAMWKYRWRGLLAAFSVATVAAIVVFVIPQKYEASARIYANTDSILKPLMLGMTVQPDINQRVAMLSRVVISRPNVEHLIQATGLDEKAKTAADRERLVDETMKQLNLEHSAERGTNNIYVVKFRDVKPDRAKHVVELLVSMFIDTNKGGGESDTEAAKAFLDEQANLYEKKLQDAENRLKEFKILNMDSASSGPGRDYFSQLATVGEQLDQARLQLREAENSRDALRRGLVGEDIVGANAAEAAANGDNLGDIDSRIDTQKRALDGLLQRYTESHPDVVGTRRVIQELEEQRRHMVETYRKSGVPLAQTAPPGPRASEQLRVSLAQAEASVASLRARVAEYSSRHRQLREMARRIPEYEAELAQLNRDYDINKRNYESLIARRESANISGDMQEVSGVADFRLVDPPRVSPNAVFPNRAVLLVMSFVASLLVGAGLTFVSKELRPCVYDIRQLRAMSGLPVLGQVSMVIDDQRRSADRRDLRKFARFAVALAATYGACVAALLAITRATA